MKATDMLKKQHPEVATLFRNALTSENPKEETGIVEEIVEKLTLHASIQEAIFYPAFQRAARGTQAAEMETAAGESAPRGLTARSDEHVLGACEHPRG
jgi:hemerythrin superfamily protein